MGHVYFVLRDTTNSFTDRHGTSVNPYISLPEAVWRAPLQAGDAILMAGSRHRLVYGGRDETWLASNMPDHECFPLRIPAGVTLGYWSDQSLYLHYGGTNYDPNGGVTCYLLYDTIVDNERSGFGFTYDNAAHAAANAWTTGSAIESSVFYDLGLGSQDHAFFPLPDSTNQLWLRIAPTTNGCWLADPDPQHVAWAPYHHSLNPPGGGVYLPGVGWDPDPVMDPFLEFGKNYGQIFPASGCILLDNGIPQAALQTDHLGNPRPAGAGNDIGCFERQ